MIVIARRKELSTNKQGIEEKTKKEYREKVQRKRNKGSWSN